MSELSPNQIQAATLLMSGMTSKNVASAINCTPETISNWKRQPAFTAFMKKLRSDLMEAGRDLLRGTIIDSFSTLRELMLNSDKDEVRRKAAIDLLRMNGFDGELQASLTRYSWDL